MQHQKPKLHSHTVAVLVEIEIEDTPFRDIDKRMNYEGTLEYFFSNYGLKLASEFVRLNESFIMFAEYHTQSDNFSSSFLLERDYMQVLEIFMNYENTSIQDLFKNLSTVLNDNSGHTTHFVKDIYGHQAVTNEICNFNLHDPLLIDTICKRDIPSQYLSIFPPKDLSGEKLICCDSIVPYFIENAATDGSRCYKIDETSFAITTLGPIWGSKGGLGKHIYGVIDTYSVTLAEVPTTPANIIKILPELFRNRQTTIEDVLYFLMHHLTFSENLESILNNGLYAFTENGRSPYVLAFLATSLFMMDNNTNFHARDYYETNEFLKRYHFYNPPRAIMTSLRIIQGTILQRMKVENQKDTLEREITINNRIKKMGIPIDKINLSTDISSMVGIVYSVPGAFVKNNIKDVYAHHFYNNPRPADMIFQENLSDSEVTDSSASSGWFNFQTFQGGSYKSSGISSATRATAFTMIADKDNNFIEQNKRNNTGVVPHLKMIYQKINKKDDLYLANKSYLKDALQVAKILREYFPWYNFHNEIRRPTERSMYGKETRKSPRLGEK